MYSGAGGIFDVKKIGGNVMNYVLGLDIGIASVGWAVIDLETLQVIESCSNIFTAAEAENNKDRRSFRQMRRLKRRLRTRISDFAKMWKSLGFSIPGDIDNMPLLLRVKGISEELSMDEIYTVLLNELKHRGISYLEDFGDNANDGTDYSKSIAINQKELEEKFPCQIQYERYCKYGNYRGQFVADINGEKVTLCNVFTTSSYRKEITSILDTQKKFHSEITDKFIENYMKIFDRKREYYVGPGNDNSRTDYGIYTTKLNDDGTYKTDKNLFEKLIGKCSVYNEELRAAAASYTAQEFNVLNDLNNLIVNGRKLEEDEKRKIVDTLKTSDSINMRKIIKKIIGEDIETLEGARIDKDEKEIFHCFEIYNKLRKELKKIEYDINLLSRDTLDDIGRILTINTERDMIVNSLSELGLDNDVVNCLADVRKKNGKLFSKWHSFSLKIMQELIPAMYEQPKEQMQLLTEMGVFKKKGDLFKDCQYIPVDIAKDDIYNPVVVKSIHIAIRIVNAIIKKYGMPEKVVVEMPRERNTEEQKKRIKDTQRKNEKELEEITKKIYAEYELRIEDKDFRNHKGLALKLKLWNEQGGVCPYSGRKIDIFDLVNHPDMFEVDHIIPLSVSLVDSRINKTLVYKVENQEKGVNTPYMYLSKITRDWGWEEYKNYILGLKIEKAKKANYLFMEDITKYDVLKKFINRNLNDTRYASRVILNTLQDFFSTKQTGTIVKVIRGSFTHQMRVNLHIEKDRDESYSHHAVDAMLLCYSQLGYDAFHKLQGSFIDFETGEILDKRMWNENMQEDVYKDYLYGNKWSQIKRHIEDAEKKVKYWHAVDSKCNRGLCNQTIYGTREIDGKIYKISRTADIRTKSGFESLKKLLAESNGKSKKSDILMYRNDPKTFQILMDIMKQYADATNPFVKYEEETGDVIRKYSKKHNGPKVTKISYMDGEVGSCIDISHKYGYAKDSKKVILESLVPYRMDVYYNITDKLYYFVGIKQSDIKCKGDEEIVNMEAYRKALVSEKMILPEQTIDDLEKLGYEFRLSFYKNDIIKYEKNGELFTERFLSRTMPAVRNYIETKPVDAPKFEKQHLIGLSKTKMVKKIRTDILGNCYECEKEEFSFICK